MNACALIIALGVISRIFSSRVKLPCKPLLALAVVMIARPQDIFLTITNIQWVMALGLVLLLISEDAGEPSQHIYDYLYAVFSGLTGVYSILLFPLFLWRLLRRKTKPSMILTAVIGLTAAIQAWLVITTPHPTDDSNPFSILTVSRIIGLRYFCLPFGGPWLVHPRMIVLLVCAILFTAWAFLLCYGSRKSTSQEISRWLLLAIIGIFTCASLFRFKDMLPLFLRNGGTRYFFIGEVLFIWINIFELKSSFLRRCLASLALYAFLVTSVCTFKLEPFVDYHWSKYAPLLD
jgi:hypothetical protein